MRALDIIVVVSYLAGVIAAGLASRGRQGDVDDYFTAKGGFSGRLGVVLVGLSIASTLFSGISFVVYTSTAYGNGARIILGVAGIPIAWAVLRYWFLSRYLAHPGTHPYDIVEARFGSGVRLCVSAMFVLLRLGWMGVMLSAPTLVVLGAGRLGPEWFWPVVLAVGLSSTLYTAIGGIRGVIVTDAIQFVVMAGGILLIIGLVLTKLALPVAAIAAELHEQGRLHVFDFSLSLTQPLTFWSVLIGLSVSSLGQYMGDLMVLQRYLAAGSPSAAARSFAINMWGVIGVIVLLVLTGLLLWIWYQHHPDPGLPSKVDQILPYFIARELPAGVSGLLIASLLAATMSSMTSGIIALAGTVTNDWVARFGRPRTQAELFNFGRRASFAIGIAATLAAGFTGQLGTLFQMSQVVMGAFQGPMLACMVFVVGPWRVRPAAVLTGMALGTLGGWVLTATPLSSLWTAPVTAGIALAVPLLARAIEGNQKP